MVPVVVEGVVSSAKTVAADDSIIAAVTIAIASFLIIFIKILQKMIVPAAVRPHFAILPYLLLFINDFAHES